ncbi:hypothetical protein EDD86DRAFT_57711 [Gorgonomyces haynaldii]|nr:hypothetical protein EDD86DRAFT_57711 [Gorgonomyces haynaldii]
MAQIDDFDSLPPEYFDFTDNGLYAGLVLHMVLGVIGLLFSLLIFVSSIGRTTSPSMILILTLTMADFMFCCAAVYFGIADTIAMRFSTGKIGCLVYANIVMISCYLSITTLGAITLERYNNVVRQKTLTRKGALQILAVLILTSFLFIMTPMLLGHYEVFALMPSHQVCAMVFWDRRAAPLSQAIIALVVILSCAGLMCYAYVVIVMTYFKHKKSRQTGSYKTDLGSQNKSMRTEEDEALELQFERRLLRKCIAISGLYIVCWTPYGIKGFIELFTERPIDPYWDSFCTILALLNSTLNPVLLYMFDARIKSNISDLLSQRRGSVLAR